MNLWIIQCSFSKLSYPAPAECLYTGKVFQLLVQAIPRTDDVLILSAKHGLIERSTILSPYETSINTDLPGKKLYYSPERSAARRQARRDGRQAVKQLLPVLTEQVESLFLTQYGEVLLCLSKDYTSVLRRAGDNTLWTMQPMCVETLQFTPLRR